MTFTRTYGLTMLPGLTTNGKEWLSRWAWEAVLTIGWGMVQTTAPHETSTDLEATRDSNTEVDMMIIREEATLFRSTQEVKKPLCMSAEDLVLPSMLVNGTT